MRTGQTFAPGGRALAGKFVHGVSAAYDPIMAQRRGGPGPAKAGAPRLVDPHHRRLFRSADYRWRELFERADVMSEGAVANDGDGRSTYYGTTSVLLPFEQVPDTARADIARLLVGDPHARVRAIRIACVEAQVRARAALGRVTAEVVVRDGPGGVRIDIDVEAPVLVDEKRTAKG